MGDKVGKHSGGFKPKENKERKRMWRHGCLCLFYNPGKIIDIL